MNEKPSENIYTNLHALVKLRYTAQGFNYLPRQPVRSLLRGRKRSRLPIKMTFTFFSNSSSNSRSTKRSSKVMSASTSGCGRSQFSSEKAYSVR